MENRDYRSYLAILVLILILMECSLGGLMNTDVDNYLCLNPYSNGMLTWLWIDRPWEEAEDVLILILMECSLGCI